MAYLIVKDDCTNCGACEDVCPVDCISEQDGARFIVADDCIECGACADECPVDCIKAP